MQLFITEYVHEGTRIRVCDSRVVRQCRTVLRMGLGDKIAVQSPADDPASVVTRYVLEITDLTKDTIEGVIIDQSSIDGLSTTVVAIAVAVPNNAKKLSLIVQKLTEIGVDAIYFWYAEYSQMRKISLNKLEKLEMVAQEAAEQSERWYLPRIQVISDPTAVMGQYDSAVVFDQGGSMADALGGLDGSILGVVGPEGGISSQDYERMVQMDYQKLTLGQTILRMETAAIVGSWVLVNGYSACVV